MEKECHQLDVTMAEKLGNADGGCAGAITTRQRFDEAVEHAHLETKKKNLESEIAELKEQYSMIGLLYSDAEPPAILLDMAAEKEREKTEVVGEKFLRTFSASKLMKKSNK